MWIWRRLDNECGLCCFACEIYADFEVTAEGAAINPSQMSGAIERDVGSRVKLRFGAKNEADNFLT